MKDQQEITRRHAEMTEKPVEGQILKMALPTMAAMLLSSFYNLADTFFVSQINTSASAAAGVAFPMLLLIQAISLSLAIGGGSYAARCLGAGDIKTANQTVSTSFFLSVLCSSAIGLAILLDLSPLLARLGATATVLPYAVDYAFYIILATPFYSASFVLTTVLRQEGSPNLAMFGSVLGAVLNIILDPIFIFGLGLGVKGAALATSLSQIASFAVLLLFELQGRTLTQISLRHFCLKWSILREIIRVGLPEFFRQILGSLAGILLNTAAALYGDSALAAISICNRIIQFIVSLLMGYGQGFMPVCGYNYGAKLSARVRRAFAFVQLTAAVALAVCAVLLCPFAPQLLHLFRPDDAEVVRIGTLMLRFQAILLPVASFVILANMLFQACGEGSKATVISLARQGLLFIPAIFLLPRLFGLTGVLISQPVADVLTGILCVPMTVGCLQNVRRQCVP